MKSRQDIRRDLETKLFAQPCILAAWEGGSQATGFADDFSDMDLVIVCEDDAVESVFSLLEDYLDSQCGITRKYRIAEPAWHGFSQCFYNIDNVPELFYMDIAVIKRSVPDKFTARDRHGIASVWFEKESVIDTTPTPQEEVAAKGRQFFQMAVQSDFLMVIEIRKNIARSRYAEAFPFYYQFVSRQLAVLLNLKYRPEKVDFGLRYASRDYGKEDAALIESLLKADSIERLAANFDCALARYEVLKNELQETWQA